METAHERVLLVDDQTEIIDLLERQLRDQFVCEFATSGAEALGKLETNGPFAVIVADYSMPNMDGITLVQEVKKLQQYKFVPICMLTTEAGQSKMQEGKAAGAKAWIVKPFQPPKLLDAVSKLLAM